MTLLKSLLGQIYLEMVDELNCYARSRLLPAIWSQYGEDIVQESFKRLFGRGDIHVDRDGQLPSLDDALSKARPLLYGIVSNVMHETIRQFRREDHNGTEQEVVAPDEVQQSDEIDSLLKIARAHCSKEEWAVFEWMAFENLGSSGIGDRLDLTAKGARSKVYRTRVRIRDAVKREACRVD